MSLFLYIGLGLGGLITGYMVSASASPVAAAAVPTVLSALVSILAVMLQNPFDAKIAELIKEKPKGEQIAELDLLRNERNRLPTRLGLILTTFFSLYGVGLLVGASVRIQDWFAKLDKAPSALTKLAIGAPTRDEAIYRITLFEALKTYGFSEQDSVAIASKSPTGSIQANLPQAMPSATAIVTLPTKGKGLALNAPTSAFSPSASGSPFGGGGVGDGSDSFGWGSGHSILPH